MIFIVLLRPINYEAYVLKTNVTSPLTLINIFTKTKTKTRASSFRKPYNINI